MRTRYPDRSMIEIDNSDGLDETMRGLVLAALDTNPHISAVYSIGGGNMAIVEAFASRRARTQSSSPTISIMTTCGCYVPAGSQPCSITTSGKTCVRLAMRSCRRTMRYLVPSTPGRRTSTSLRHTTCPRRLCPSMRAPSETAQSRTVAAPRGDALAGLSPDHWRLVLLWPSFWSPLPSSRLKKMS